MKTILSVISIVFLCTNYSNAQNAQQQKVKGEPFSLTVNGLMVVRNFDSAAPQRKCKARIPAMGLKFEIVGKFNTTELNQENSIQASLGQSSDGEGPCAMSDKPYYVLKFYEIKSKDTDEKGKTAENMDPFIDDETMLNSKQNKDYFWIYKVEYEALRVQNYILEEHRYGFKSISLDYGVQFSLPFKYRPEIDSSNIKITPDINLGGYLGIKFRVSKSKDYFLSLVGTAGTAILDINDSNTRGSESQMTVETVMNTPMSTVTTTTTESTPSADGTVLGVTWNVGAVFELEKFQVGFTLGRDRAGGQVGKDWIYNDQTWYSLSVGYTFLNKKVKTKPESGM